jgi:hypothetical protein
MIEAVGANGRISLDGDTITISRKGAGVLTFLNQGLQGDKTIPIHQITAVQFRPAGMARGYIRLSMSGRDPVGGLFEAVKDENAVLFDGKSRAEFEAMRDAINARINRPSRSGGAPLADEIEKLAALRASGALSEEEFTASKKRLLEL